MARSLIGAAGYVEEYVFLWSQTYEVLLCNPYTAVTQADQFTLTYLFDRIGK